MVGLLNICSIGVTIPELPAIWMNYNPCNSTHMFQQHTDTTVERAHDEKKKNGLCDQCKSWTLLENVESAP